jgi:hypothetical protein
MSNRLKKPALNYRLTLKTDVLKALMLAPKKPFTFLPLYGQGNEINVAISTSMADQLMTFAKPGENLSDTVVRILNRP